MLADVVGVVDCSAQVEMTHCWNGFNSLPAANWNRRGNGVLNGQ
jgi:hypothetical protein